MIPGSRDGASPDVVRPTRDAAMSTKTHNLYLLLLALIVTAVMGGVRIAQGNGGEHSIVLPGVM